jgi:Fur family ferric uptake transcriptional regulator
MCLWAVLKFAAMMTVLNPSVDSPAEAEAAALLIRRIGARATPARVRVLRLLRAAPAALTHHQIEQSLGDLALDRVTLYRVLEWLVESGLAHRNTDAQRMYRFSAAAAGEHAAHTHFRCDECGRVFCLDAAPPAPPSLPAGFSLSRLELDLRGRCARCTGDESHESVRRTSHLPCSPPA